MFLIIELSFKVFECQIKEQYISEHFSKMFEIKKYKQIQKIFQKPQYPPK